MEHTTSSFCYVDDDGQEVPAGEESSLLASLGIVHHGDAPSVDVGVERQYSEDPEEFERERAAAWKRLAAADAAPPVEERPLPPSGGPDTDDGDYEEEEEEGMGGYTFSREATATEEEWLLERIVSRRVVRSGKGGSDYKEFYDDFGEKKTGMMEAGRVEYLCKWKGYVEPTWETRELMEDEGFVRELRAFDDVALSRLSAPLAPKWDDLTARERGLAERPLSLTGGDGRGPVLRGQPVAQKCNKKSCYFADTSVVEQLAADDFLGSVSRLSRAANLHVVQYGSIATTSQISTFLATARRLSDTHRPKILFHGTQIQNIPKIAATGLQVPGSSGIKVVNGSVHGVGIYAANEPSMSIYYCSSLTNNLRMLACVGLVSNSDPDITVHAGFVVLKRSELILPLWALDLYCGHIVSPKDAVQVAHTPTSLSRPLHTPNTEEAPIRPRHVHTLQPSESAALTKVKRRNIAELAREEDGPLTTAAQLIRGRIE